MICSFSSKRKLFPVRSTSGCLQDCCAALDKALQTAQEPDPEDDGTAVTRSEAAATEKESTLPWRSLMGPLRSFAKEHPGFPLCEIQTNGTHVKILL